MIELVGKGHPDKFADFIADSILDYLDGETLHSKNAIEVICSHDIVLVAGETTCEYFNNDAIVAIIKRCTKEIYGEEYLKKWQPEITIKITKQSPELTTTVNNFLANDQGYVVGYASPNKDWNYLSYEHYVATKVCDIIEANQYTKADFKVMVDTDVHGKIKIFCSCSHDEGNLKLMIQSLGCEPFCSCSHDEGNLKLMIHSLSSELYEEFGDDLIDLKINTGGTFTLYGPLADTGLTGRKLACDNYGLELPIGGGAFSGKDFSKLDRSAAYYARMAAKEYAKHTNDDAVVQIHYFYGDEYAKAIVNDEETIEIKVKDIVKTCRNEFGMYSKLSYLPFVKI